MSEITVCPECDSHRIRWRTAKDTPNKIGDEPYRCLECTHRFTTPAQRERKGKSKHSGERESQQILRDADPSDWPK